VTPEKKAKLIAAIAVRLMRLIFATLRFQVTDRAGLLEKVPQKPLLWTFWHNRLFIAPYIFERYFKGRPGRALISNSKDGELIAAIIGHFGIGAIRGSTSRGAARSLVAMKRAVMDGYVMAITPDGPRGPKYSLSPGVVKLAQITHGTIMPLRISYSSFWRIRKSWDGFMIPKPFSKVHVTFDTLHVIPGTATEEEFEDERLRFERVLQPQDGE
jgi:lysophospholipid acyltransferase (LPLAT)-like uncharacterized protein